jgi:hypothetical protein
MSVDGTMPYSQSKAIALSDTVNIDGTVVSTTGRFQTSTNTKPIPCDAISVGTAGNVIYVMESGVSGTLAAAAGQILPIRAIRLTASTTSTGCVALYYTNPNQ